MEIKENLNKMINRYFLIFGLIVLLTVLFMPDYSFDRSVIIRMAIAALLGDLPGILVLNTDHLSLYKYRIRMILHFILTEAMILIYAFWIGLIDSMVKLFAGVIEIAVVYFCVYLIGWWSDRNLAEKLNQRLKEEENGKEA